MGFTGRTNLMSSGEDSLVPVIVLWLGGRQLENFGCNDTSRPAEVLEIMKLPKALGSFVTGHDT